jgi:hypothetical protein
MSIVLDGTSGITTPALDSVARFATADMPLGSVLQVVSTTKTDTFSESVASGALSGVVTGLTASITPSSASNKILVILSVTVNYEASYISLTENGSVIVQGDAAGNRQRVTGGTGLPFSEFYPMTTTVQFLHSPSSTSPLTYGCKLSSSSSSTKTLYVNRGGTDTDIDEVMRGVSTITVMEIAA